MATTTPFEAMQAERRAALRNAKTRTRIELVYIDRDGEEAISYFPTPLEAAEWSIDESVRVIEVSELREDVTPDGRVLFTQRETVPFDA